MNRRRFASGLAAVSLAMPFSLRAQQPARLRRVAIVGIGDLEKFPLSSVVKGMRELGYHDGRNVEYFRPIARGSYEDLAGLATAAVNRQAEVIVTYGSTATAAAKAATRDIPIVMLLGVDPVRLGFVGNLARPEGNITGIVTGTRLLAAKQVELVKDAVPGARRLAVLWSATSATQADTLKIVEAAATRLGLVVVPIEVNRPDDLKTLSTALSKARADVLLTIGTAMLTARRDEVVGIVAAQKLPAVFASSEFVRSGGLMSYSTDQTASFHRSATYVDRILKGAKPADLPVEQPTKFELVVNLKTAKALGIEIPKSVMFRADEVIQ